MLQGKQLHRAGLQLFASSGSAIRLGVYRHDLVRAVDQSLQMGGRKGRGTSKDDFQGLHEGIRYRGWWHLSGTVLGDSLRFVRLFLYVP